MARHQRVPGQAVAQLADGIRRAARPHHEDHLGLQQGRCDLGVIGAKGCAPLAGRNDGDLGMIVLQVLAYVIGYAARHLRRVQLEARWRFQHVDANRRGQPTQHRIVDALRAGRDLSRAETDHYTWLHSRTPLALE